MAPKRRIGIVTLLSKEATVLQNIQPMEILLVVLVIVLFFTARKLPDLARSIGRSRKEFRKGLEEGADESDDEGPTSD